ncbi:putative mitochondrial hypothetical protein [Leptomonas pyrrhocoris]|uniref:Thioredoxin-like fold domain-containing protein n=1 Tax=Leptomonas pyrrhocoris TaxID=157538 RepID=A0A0M9FSR9_LEPPY|nr:putative mitochondrial hypothetical protein [Leptomonas pyrrhocoris]XP_015653677.1 putative mitochondrial hypothetical protein [Leptomonas pyrrhocoris]KPA75237.1 putative mitochondrial hypothetical protein [Leptomonas pyrrhocoris]KPA75238.1 putative mitochondrial hypothetical protein [Leptomonas pyrrhocoris]|eukprot:XP_015653676.1 putative mitochondrial hypothetical protein [Leptomonas pyrrhocoris]
MRFTGLLRRTSRKGPGSWSEPILLHSRHRSSEGSPRPTHDADTAATAAASPGAYAPKGHVKRKGVGRSPNAAGAVSSASASSSAAAFFDGADNAYQYASARGLDSGHGEIHHPSHYNWKADPALNNPPPQMDFARGSLRGEGHGSVPHGVKRVTDSIPPIHDFLKGGGEAGESRQHGTGTNWLGGDRGKAIPDTLERATMQHSFGAGEFSMVDRQKVTLTRFLRLLMDATLKPRDADSRVFGGDGATKLAEQREELKTLDQRIAPFQHDELLNDYLKNMDRLHTPSGAICEREVLLGRLVGILFFTESERSLDFMRRLQPFHKTHSPDFVVVAVSLAGKEMMDVTRSLGFFHCTHRDGATWVTRDCGLMIRPFMPLPRLLIVNGTTGIEVTRGGVTAVVANPSTCFQAWRRGDRGYSYRDFLQSMYL